MNKHRKTRIPVPAGSVNPLAKAMEKKPKPPPKSTINPQPETWYDEEIKSVSQKQQHQSKTEHEKRRDALYAQLKKTEEELLSMQGLLEQREKLIKEAEEDGESPGQNENGSNVASEDGGASGESGEQPEKVEKITKKTMKGMRDRMQDMREKLGKMNKDTDHYLADIENTMQYLESLETASDRLGPLSAETRSLFRGADDDKIIAQIYKENNIPISGEAKRGDKNKDRQSSDEDEEEEEETPRDKSNPSKFFLTERAATTTNPVQTTTTTTTTAAAECDDGDGDDDDDNDDDNDDASDQ